MEKSSAARTKEDLFYSIFAQIYCLIFFSTSSMAPLLPAGAAHATTMHATAMHIPIGQKDHTCNITIGQKGWQNNIFPNALQFLLKLRNTTVLGNYSILCPCNKILRFWNTSV
jgi:hypothetical protein